MSIRVPIVVGFMALAFAAAESPARAGSSPPPLLLPVPTGAVVKAGGPHPWNGGDTGTRSSVDIGPVVSGGELAVHAAAGGTAHLDRRLPNGVPCQVSIDHAGGWRTRYLHLKNVDSSIDGKTVAAGQRLGDAGQPGSETCGSGSRNFRHVHFSLWKDRREVAIDGVSIGGYTVHQTGRAYCGHWTRDRDGSVVADARTSCVAMPQLVAESAATCTGRLGVVFVLDDSGSNVQTDPSLLRAAATRVALSFLPDRTEVAAVRFADGSDIIFRHALLSASNKNELGNQIERVLDSRGSTNYESGFQTTIRLLDEMTTVQRKVVIFLSDGMPTAPYSSHLTIGQRGIPIYTVGYGSASKEVLEDISTQTNAKTQTGALGSFQIDNISQAQNVFAQVVNPLVCNTPITTGTGTVTPSRAVSAPFRVASSVPGFTALATWSTGAVPAVALRRPDGSVLSGPNNRRVNESIQRPSSNAIRFDVANPQAGSWHLVATTSDPRGVLFGFDVWSTASPAVDVAAAAAIPGGCPTAVKLGPLWVRGCWRRGRGGTLHVTRGVRVNGVVLLCRGGFSFDPRTGVLSSNGRAALAIGGYTLGRDTVRWTAAMVRRKEIRFATSGRLKGIRLVGAANLLFTIRRSEPITTIVANVAVPIGPHRVTGQIPLNAGEAHGFVVDGVNVYAAGNTPVDWQKRMLLRQLTLWYQKGDDRWIGKATLALPVGAVAGAPGVTVLSSFARGQMTPFQGETGFAGGRALVPGFGVRVVTVGVTVRPIALAGGIQVAFGPSFGGQPLFQVAGSAVWKPAGGWVIDGKADIPQIFGSFTGRVTVPLDTPRVGLAGKFGFSVPGLGARGDLSGFAVGSRFNAFARGAVQLQGAPEVRGQILLSSRGAAACGQFSFLRAGIGYVWQTAGGDLAERLLGAGCDLGAWTAPTAPGTPIRVSAGVPFVMFRAVGAGGAPEVVVRGPSGESFDSRAGDYIDRPDVFVWHDRTRGQTYLAVPKPQAGAWTVTPAAGALSAVRSAVGLRNPIIRVRVRAARGGRRTLVYALRNLGANERVSFFEGIGNQGFTKPIVLNVRRSGTVTFIPEGVGPRLRNVWALVTSSGLPRVQGIFGRFRYAPAPVANAPTLTGRRSGRTVVVRWSRSGGVYWHALIASDDGRRVFFRYAPSQRVVRYAVDPRYEMTVTVRAVDQYGREGKPGQVTVAPGRRG